MSCTDGGSTGPFDVDVFSIYEASARVRRVSEYGNDSEWELVGWDRVAAATTPSSRARRAAKNLPTSWHLGQSLSEATSCLRGMFSPECTVGREWHGGYRSMGGQD
jgi:hypothetical protein